MPTKEATKPPKNKKDTESSFGKYLDFLFGQSALEKAAGKPPKPKKKKAKDTGYIRNRIRENRESREAKLADDEEK